MSGSPRALVTGSAGGIGGAIVERLIAEGHRVATIDVRADERGGVERHFVADLADGDACVQATEQAVEVLGGLDVLVHAAGITRDAVLWKLAPDDWSATLAVNLDAAFHLARAAVPVLRAGGGGAIVFVSSINGDRGKFGQSAYAASKSGLNGLTRSLAREVGRFEIRVNAVAPGLIETAMTTNLPESVLADAKRESCFGRLGQPEDVAAAIAFLVSGDARHVTGQVLRVDGGQLM